MQEVPGVSDYEPLDARAVHSELDGVAVRVLGLADLIVIKRAADRPRDRDDVIALDEIARLGEQS
jgi:predicted nucleotidyltransferase